jgi:hypothetical protein
MARWASWIHKWLALLMAIQILSWFVSGLFFALAPIETVRSEHRIANQGSFELDLSANAQNLEQVAQKISAPVTHLELRSLLGRPVVITTRTDGDTALYDLATAYRLPGVSERQALSIAEAYLSGDETAVGVSSVEKPSTEYRGPLPAWRVDFEQASRSVYVSANTGEVTAIRSTLWRVFDVLWSLHIMDFENHEDFNTPLLIAATLLGLAIVLSGFIMFPSRLGYHAWRRRRRRLRLARTRSRP